MNPEDAPTKPEQIQPAQAEKTPKEPETAEELSGQIDGQKKHLQDELQRVSKKRQTLSDEQDPDVDPALLDQTRAELDSLNQEAQTLVNVSMFQLDELDGPEQQSKQVNLTDEPSTKEIESPSVDTAESLLEIQEIFKDFDKQITALAEKDGFSKEKLEEKSQEIKNSLVESVVNGHLETSDVLNMVRSVEIFSTHSDDPAEQEEIDRKLAQFGYESTMFVDANDGTIYVIDNALRDKYTTSDGKELTINLNHTLNHEISHILDKRAGILKNKTLLDACDQLAQMEGFAGTQSMHIRNTLESEGLTQNTIRAEIIADYTALYLKSDGSFPDFVSECLKMTDIRTMQEQLELNEDEISAILENAGDRDQIIEKIKENNPKFAEILKVYGSFHQEIDTATKESKGNILPQEEEEDEEVDESGGIFAESAPASADPPQNSKNEESIISLFLGVAKAIGDETGGKAIPQAGPGL